MKEYTIEEIADIIEFPLRHEPNKTSFIELIFPRCGEYALCEEFITPLFNHIIHKYDESKQLSNMQATTDSENKLKKENESLKKELEKQGVKFKECFDDLRYTTLDKEKIESEHKKLNTMHKDLTDFCHQKNDTISKLKDIITAIVGKV